MLTTEEKVKKIRNKIKYYRRKNVEYEMCGMGNEQRIQLINEIEELVKE